MPNEVTPGNVGAPNTTVNKPGTGFGVDSDLDILNRAANDKPDVKTKDKADVIAETDDVEADTAEVDEPENAEDVADEILDEEKPDEEEVDEEVVDEPEPDLDKVFEGRPSLTDIKAKYPEIFKQFPELKQVLFREAEYSNLFPTVEEAKRSAGRADLLTNIENDIKEANTAPLLETVKGGGQDYMLKLSQNFLTSLEKIDRPVFIETIKPVLKNLVRNMYSVGKNKNNDQLYNAALIMHEYVFGDYEYEKGYESPLSKKDDPERKQFETEKTEFERKQFESAAKDINFRIDRSIGRIVERSLEKVDNLTPFLKNSITEKITKKIYDTLAKDQRHQATMKSHWSTAAQQGYAEDSKARAITAFLARAKSIIPAIRNEVLKEAFSKGQDRQPVARRPAPSGKIPPTNKIPSSGAVDWSKVKGGARGDMEILNGKIPLKG